MLLHHHLYPRPRMNTLFPGIHTKSRDTDFPSWDDLPDASNAAPSNERCVCGAEDSWIHEDFISCGTCGEIQGRMIDSGAEYQLTSHSKSVSWSKREKSFPLKLIKR
jgi:hypothetical protein